MTTQEDDESRRIARAILPEGLRRETLAVRTAMAPSQHGENSEALFLTSGFMQPEAATMARRFAASEDFTYGRTSNPTVRSFEARLAALEGTESAIATSSGMSAILLLGMGLLKAGDHVICSRIGVRLDDQPVREGVREVRRARPPSSRRPIKLNGSAAIDPSTRSCCSPRRRPTR